MEKTLQNLMDSFAGESQANRKYLAYSKKAEKEGKTNAAKLFKVLYTVVLDNVGISWCSPL